MKHLLVPIFCSLIAVSSLAWGAKGGGGKPPKDDVTDLVFTDDGSGSKVRLYQGCTGELAGSACLLEEGRGYHVQDGIEFQTNMRVVFRRDLLTNGTHVNCATNSDSFYPLEVSSVWLSSDGAIMGTTAEISGDKVTRDALLQDPYNDSVSVLCLPQAEFYVEATYRGIGRYECISGTKVFSGSPEPSLLTTIERLSVTMSGPELSGLTVPASCP